MESNTIDSGGADSRQRQYSTDRNLRARMRMHREYSTNRRGWFRWLFESLALRPGDRILDVGCGNGVFWRVIAGALPPTCSLQLTDVSPGMIRSATASLADVSIDVQYSVMNAESLEFETDSFDVVLASHMLYHVADRQAAIAEARRVLIPTGRMIAATNGVGHMQQLDALARRFLSRFDPVSEVSRFSLDTGCEQLALHFETVERHVYDDGLIVPHPEAVFDYIMSLPDAQDAPEHEVDALRRCIDSTVDEEHPMVIDKESGAFVCW